MSPRRSVLAASGPLACALLCALGVACTGARAPAASPPAAPTASHRGLQALTSDSRQLLLERQRSRRPDSPILDDLRKILAQDSGFRDVMPTVRQRVVALTGTVESAEVSARAARRAFEVPGVYAVVNGLEIVPHEPRVDAALRRSIEQRLAAHPSIASSSVRVRVERGRAILEGQVGSAEERWMVVDAAASVPGVSGVHERLGLERDRNPAPLELAERVRAALLSRPPLASGDLRVSVVGGRVHVELPDAAALEPALRRAYDAGAFSVVFAVRSPRPDEQPRFLWSDAELPELGPGPGTDTDRSAQAL